MQAVVYVINANGAPLMPCDARKARLLLRDHKARVVHKTPLTIALVRGASGYRQEIVAALDTGSTVVGTTGKLFGLRKGDMVKTAMGVGFVKGKRSTGCFSIADLDGRVIHASEKAHRCQRISARSTTQIECMRLNQLLNRRKEKEVQMQIQQQTKSTKAKPSALSLTDLKDRVSRAI